MSTIKSVLCFAIVALLFPNCSETTEPENSTGELIPLKVGNSWNYTEISYDSSGSIIQTQNVNRTMVKDTSILNYTWYADNEAPDGVWFTNKPDGHWAFIKANTGLIINDTTILVYKYPPQVGDIYGDSSEVVSIDEGITVPAGRFRAIHIVGKNPNSIGYTLMYSCELFIAPQVGIVKKLQFGRKENGEKFLVVNKELQSYLLK